MGTEIIIGKLNSTVTGNEGFYFRPRRRTLRQAQGLEQSRKARTRIRSNNKIEDASGP